MSREVRRVPLDFDWPMEKVWGGYLMPDHLHENPCPDCKNGYSRHGQLLMDMWYGNAPFDPSYTGSTFLRIDTPGVRAFAERNVSRSPEYYGAGELAIRREAHRLATMWNRQWCHHLAQEDVDALVEAGRLYDFTHTWESGKGWQPIMPPVNPTAAQVNEWSLSGFGHDSINASVAVRARCVREGEPEVCGTCNGHAGVEAYEGQRAEAEAWEATEPPTGEGWQLWETVSEGSPVTPVFATREGLVEHLSSAAYSRRLTRDEAEGLVDAGWVPSGVGVAGRGFVPGEISEGDFARVVLGLPEGDES